MTSTSMTMTTTTSRKMTTIGIFVSSVQKELNDERTAVRDYIKTDPLLRIYFEPFLFESMPAVDREPEELYLSEVDGCSIYLGIFGNEYGPENKQGISPVELEFERATEKSKHRLIFLKGKDDNHRIAHPLYLTHYIEKIGYGTIQMITGCREAGLPEPEFAQSGGEFVVTLWRDWLTESMLAECGLNERQMRAVRFVKEKGRIGNSEYQDLVKISKRNASRDLADLVEKEIFEKKGIHGTGVHYILSKRAKKGPMGP